MEPPIKYAFISDVTYTRAQYENRKLARVYDMIIREHSNVEVRWIMRKGELAQFRPDKIFVDPTLAGRETPSEVADYPCEKDYTLETWLRNE